MSNFFSIFVCAISVAFALWTMIAADAAAESRVSPIEMSTVADSKPDAKAGKESAESGDMELENDESSDEGIVGGDEPAIDDEPTMEEGDDETQE